MKRALAKRTIKLATWIVILAIIGLVLTSFIPWISVEENEAVKAPLHFNKAMMEKSDNEQIKDLSGHLNLINILFWLLIIFGLVFIIGLIIHATGKYPSLAPIMMLIGLENLVVSILAFVLQIIFIKNVVDNANISLSSIAPPFYYAIFPVIFSIFLLISTIIFTKVVVLPLTIIFKGSENEQKAIKPLKKKIIKSPKKASEPNEIKEQTSIKQKQEKEKIKTMPVTDKNRMEMEKWLIGQAQKIDSQNKQEKIPEPEKFDEKPIDDEKKLTEKEETDKKLSINLNSEKNVKEESLEPFLEKNSVQTAPKQNIEKLKIESDGKSFEKALASAIEKKQIERKKENSSNEGLKKDEKIEQVKQPIKEEENEENPKKPKSELTVKKEVKIESLTVEKTPEEKQKNEAKQISVKCPQCNHKFSFELGKDITKIKCPKCGKEGVLK